MHVLENSRPPCRPRCRLAHFRDISLSCFCLFVYDYGVRGAAKGDAIPPQALQHHPGLANHSKLFVLRLAFLQSIENSFNDIIDSVPKASFPEEG